MPLSIRIISSPDGEPITQWNQVFPETGGEIGRAFGCVMQLSDRQREVSGSHAMVRKTSGGYQIEDRSSNGLYINGSSCPLGKGNIALLNDGDVLDIGCYRLLVSCFSPDTLGSSHFNSIQNGIDPLLNDDPFSSVSKPAPPINVSKKIENIVSQPGIDNIEEDPFSCENLIVEETRKEFLLDFNASEEDAPFSGEEYKATFPSPLPFNTSSGKVHQRYAPPTHEVEALKRAEIDKALEMALTRFLSDISPELIEQMFDELAPSKSWLSRPRYWQRYKRYFMMQIENGDWKIKLNAYFHDALRVQDYLNGDRR